MNGINRGGIGEFSTVPATCTYGTYIPPGSYVGHWGVVEDNNRKVIVAVWSNKAALVKKDGGSIFSVPSLEWLRRLRDDLQSLGASVLSGCVLPESEDELRSLLSGDNHAV